MKKNIELDVVISRARGILFINILSLSNKNEGLLCGKGFEIINQTGMWRDIAIAS